VGAIPTAGTNATERPLRLNRNGLETMNTEPTARQQFARDLLLVLDNTGSAYEEIRNKAMRLNNDTYQLALFIEEFVENKIAEAMKQRPSDYTASVGTLLIAQLCNGWGLDAYYPIAKEIMERLDESAGV